MSSYNNVLNNNSKRKHALIEALVAGVDLPANDFELNEVLQGDTEDSLLSLFAQRDFSDVKKVMELQSQKFGVIDKELFWSVIAYVAAHGQLSEGTQLEELAQRAAAHVSHIPDDRIFAKWHEFYGAYFKDALHYFDTIVPSGLKEYEPLQLQIIFEAALEWSGLSKKGWRVMQNHRTNFVSIAKSDKKILIGSSRIRLSRQRLIGLLVHELYIHATWSEYYGEGERDTSREEGIGTLMEQLTLNAFQPLRMYRFLAICFAVGIDGVKRDMRQTFDLLVEVRRALTPSEADEIRRRFIAKEVVRVFRNLPADIPGLVYIRDKHYLEHNAAIWSKLTEGAPTMKRFTSLVAPWEGI